MQQKISQNSRSAKGPQQDARKLLEDFRHYKGIILRGWRFIACCVLATLTAGVIYLATKKPTYNASTRLLIIQQSDHPVHVAGGGDGMGSRPEDNLATHLILLKSPSLIENAIELSGLRSVSVGQVIANLTVKQPETSAKIIDLVYKSPSADECRLVLDGVVNSYKQFLKSNYQKNTSDVIGLITKARNDLSAELRTLEQAYLEFRQKNPAYSADSDGHSFVSRRLDQWDQTLNLFSARAVQLQSQLELGKKMAREGVDAATIASALNQVGSIGGELPVGYSTSASAAPTNDGSYVGIAKELAEVEARRKMAELFLENFEREHHVPGAIKPVSDAEVERAFLADPTVADLVAEMDQVEEHLAYAKRAARSSTDHAVVIQSKHAEELKKEYQRLWETKRPQIIASLADMANPNLGEGYREAEAEVITTRAREAALRARLEQVAVEELEKLHVQHERQRREHGDAHPLVVQLKQKITDMEGRQRQAADAPGGRDNNALLDYMAQSLQSIQAMRNDLQKKFEEDLSVAKKAETTLLEEENLRNNLERQRTLFNSVVDQLKQARLVSDFESVSMQTIAKTSVGAEHRATYPVLLFSLIVGLGLGSGVAFLSDFVEAKVRTMAEMRRLVDVPLIGVIPLNREAQLVDVEKGSNRLLSYQKPRSVMAEAYRTLRTNLEFQRRARQARVILITSPLPGDGKTTTVCNLAIALANTGRRVLLIDGDLRKPSLHREFDVIREGGLTDVLISGQPVEQSVKTTFIPNLDLLTTGTDVANPSELLASERSANLVERLQGQYDVVLIDSSPLLLVTDPSIIAASSDGIVLVVRISSTRRHDMDATNDLIKTLGVPVLGMVINGVPQEEVGYGYGYGYAYGGKSGNPYVQTDDETAKVKPSLVHDPSPDISSMNDLLRGERSSKDQSA